MSLLTVAQAIAEEVGLPSPTVVAGSSNKTTKQLLRLINRSGKTLAKKNWTILQREHTFSTVNGTAAYALPADYERMLVETCWDRTQYWQLRGGLSARDWQVRKSALIATTSLRSNFRLKPDTRVNKAYIDPTPTSARDLVFEYSSNQWVKDSTNANGKAAYSADDDVAIISEELIELDVIWRVLNRKGFAYEEEKLEADRQIDRAFGADRAPQSIDMGGARAGANLQTNIPEGNFG
jgi:hypothetical protein